MDCYEEVLPEMLHASGWQQKTEQDCFTNNLAVYNTMWTLIQNQLHTTIRLIFILKKKRQKKKKDKKDIQHTNYVSVEIQ